MHSPGRGSTAILLLLLPALLLAGCGDVCRIGESECLADSLIRTCISSDDELRWFVHSCGTGERCRAAGQLDVGDAGDAGDATASAAPSDMTAACVASCRTGAHECVSDALARHCVGGGMWQLEACDVGERCDEGLCIVSSDARAVRRCEPNAKACAGAKVEKVCQPDGSGWVELPCAANEVCDKDGCVPDQNSSCDDQNSCIDSKTAARCLGLGKGFELVKCGGDTYCEAGRCRGAVCAVGSVCSGGNQVRECVDGVRYRDTQCGVNETCQQAKDRASCVPLACEVGSNACGDPRDASVDPKKFFTTCSLSAAGSGIPEWVTGECTGNTSCNPALASTTNPCSQTCTKGAQRCASDALTGVNDGFQTCGDDGQWGPVETCNRGNQSEKQCVIAPNPDASVLPKALCAEPVCWWAFSNPVQRAEGACDGDQLRRCKSDGTLSDAATCAHGVCRTLNAVVTADGRTPAACDPSALCEEGEEQCLSANGAPTPRYRSCVNGVFGTEIKTCDNDGLCYNTRDSDGKRNRACGAQCAPGSGRCNSAGELERCGMNGRWGNGQSCSEGVCRALGSNDASCVLECVPGRVSCSGASIAAPDGYHTGRSEQRRCERNGSWADPTACRDAEVCRVTSSGVALGCVACLGPNAPGGNAEGVIDTRCDPDNTDRVQDCGTDNKWQASRTCAAGKSCVGPVTQSCGACTGAAGGTLQCTDSNLRNEQICAPCNVPLSGGGSTGISACTQTAIAAVNGASASSCSGISSGGSPGSWAGVSDCCSGYQRTALQQQGASCSSLGYGSPTSWAGVSDCCNNYRLGTAGASFAYCE